MSVILLTTGVPGCGKTYVRASRFLVDDFLINSTGVHISNFPLNVDEISKEVSKNLSGGLFSFLGRKRKKVTAEDIRKRIHIIPDEELQKWRREESGPWDYFAGIDLKYAHIAIDEIHNFVSPTKSLEYVQKWDEFLGEIRHRGCTFEGLTQDIDQVDKVFTGRASVRLELIPGEDLRDPFFKIRMSDWYELKASFTGHYHKTVFEFEKRKQGRSWKINHTRRFLITAEYFRFYNSFNASLAEKESSSCELPEFPAGEGDAEEKSSSAEDRAIQYEYQRRTKLSLLWWFLSRNFFSLSWRIVLAVFLFWLCFCGGLTHFINGWLSMASQMSKSNGIHQKQAKKAPTVSSGAVEGGVGVPTGGKKAPKDLKDMEFQKALKAENEDIFKPAMFFDGFCWLRNGIKITVNYKFKGGIYDGKTVKEINQQERYYKLDNDVSVNMY